MEKPQQTTSDDARSLSVSLPNPENIIENPQQTAPPWRWQNAIEEGAAGSIVGAFIGALAPLVRQAIAIASSHQAAVGVSVALPAWSTWLAFTGAGLGLGLGAGLAANFARSRFQRRLELENQERAQSLLTSDKSFAKGFELLQELTKAGQRKRETVQGADATKPVEKRSLYLDSEALLGRAGTLQDLSTFLSRISNISDAPTFLTQALGVLLKQALDLLSKKAEGELCSFQTRYTTSDSEYVSSENRDFYRRLIKWEIRQYCPNKKEGREVPWFAGCEIYLDRDAAISRAGYYHELNDCLEKVAYIIKALFQDPINVAGARRHVFLIRQLVKISEFVGASSDSNLSPQPTSSGMPSVEQPLEESHRPSLGTSETRSDHMQT